MDQPVEDQLRYGEMPVVVGVCSHWADEDPTDESCGGCVACRAEKAASALAAAEARAEEAEERAREQTRDAIAYEGEAYDEVDRLKRTLWEIHRELGRVRLASGDPSEVVDLASQLRARISAALPEPAPGECPSCGSDDPRKCYHGTGQHPHAGTVHARCCPDPFHAEPAPGDEDG